MNWSIVAIGLFFAVVTFYLARSCTINVICKRSLATYRESCDNLLRRSASTQRLREELYEKLPFTLLHLSEEESERTSKRVDQIQSEIDALQNKTSAHPKAPVEQRHYRAQELQDLRDDVTKLARSHVEIQSKLTRAMEELTQREQELSNEGIRDRIEVLNEMAEKSSFAHNTKNMTKLVATVFLARESIGSQPNTYIDTLLKEAENMIRQDGPLKWQIPTRSPLYRELQNRNAPAPVLIR